MLKVYFPLYVVLGGGVLVMWLSHGYNVATNEGRDPSHSPTLKTVVYKPGLEPSPDTESTAGLILDLPASRSVRNKCSLLITTPIYGNLLE